MYCILIYTLYVLYTCIHTVCTVYLYTYCMYCILVYTLYECTCNLKKNLFMKREKRKKEGVWNAHYSHKSMEYGSVV